MRDKNSIFRPHEAGEHALNDRRKKKNKPKNTLVCTNDSHSELQD